MLAPALVVAAAHALELELHDLHMHDGDLPVVSRGVRSMAHTLLPRRHVTLRKPERLLSPPGSTPRPVPVAEGQLITSSDLEQLSPIQYAHIRPYGRYQFKTITQPDPLRPLRNPAKPGPQPGIQTPRTASDA